MERDLKRLPLAQSNLARFSVVLLDSQRQESSSEKKKKPGRLRSPKSSTVSLQKIRSIRTYRFSSSCSIGTVPKHRPVIAVSLSSSIPTVHTTWLAFQVDPKGATPASNGESGLAKLLCRYSWASCSIHD